MICLIKLFSVTIFSLIKCCSQCYIKIRMYHLGKQHTDALQVEKIRKRLSKLVLLKHQLGCYQMVSSPHITKIACVDLIASLY